ncbi:ATP-binding cassette domain-containing protein [Geminicoccus flavidas]|uniref:ATP-binding cassette domain-containing protein n=1 Tax=Geminicoccus flavidas TaxID=2506407 RepID=UPI00190F705F|nr:ATP-binding cassette domain-containing protein [Geminicoccus flavidas]
MRAVDEMDLAFADGAFFTFLGPSGCGQTTSLDPIAGFEQPNRGEVCIRGQNLAATLPWQRPVNMVFQAYALFPIGNALVGLFLQSRSWPFGAAIATTVVAVMLLLVSVAMRLGLRREPGPGAGAAREPGS